MLRKIFFFNVILIAGSLVLISKVYSINNNSIGIYPNIEKENYLVTKPIPVLENTDNILPFIEDWENNSGTTVNNGTIYNGINYSWEFETDLPGKGRSAWGSNAYMAHSGNGALTMDKDFPTSSYSINYSILSIDLSAYISSSGLELSFYWTDHGDEEHSNDKVWIRGNDSEEWVMAYDINPQSFSNNQYNFSETIDIDALLASAGQTVSETFQVKFGQQDNGPVKNDGISFDDILINESGVFPFVKPPYLTFNGIASEMELHWQLNSTMPSTIEWGLNEGYVNSSTTTEYGDSHQHTFQFTSLESSTRYYYKVTSGSEFYTGNFLSAPLSTATNTSFFVYGDHRTFPQRHDSVVKKIVEIINLSPEEQTFILSAGDMVGHGNVEAEWNEQLFATGFPNIREMLSKLPLQATMGNHEQDGILFAKYLPYPFISGGGANGNYWSFDYANVHISVVDQYVDYTTGSDQYNWLVNDLQNTDRTWKFILLHQPGLSVGVYVNDYNVLTYIQPLAELYGVQMIFAGHVHLYARGQLNNVVHITTGGGGSNLYDPDENAPFIDVALKSYHFCKINIVGNAMRLLAINRDGDTIDDFSILTGTCVDPSEIAASNISTTSAELSWTENGSATSWQTRVVEKGADTTNVIPVSVSSNPYNISGLTASSSYDFYLRSDCSAGYYSAWIGPITFSTQGQQILPFIEDWELNNGVSNVNGEIYSGAAYNWTFETNLPGKGRTSWGSNAYLAHGGNGALTLDKDFPTSSYSINYSILSIDLSAYISSSGLELSFYWTDHGDEEHSNDKVWIRGSQSDDWVQAYDINPQSFSNNQYRSSGAIDIDELLASALPSQIVSETFQVKFGQQDNGPIPNDGLSFDDITIQENVPPPAQSGLIAGGINGKQQSNVYDLINYPNPFKGTTTIQFTLESTNYTKLTVYNSLGLEVAKLYDGQAEGKLVYQLEFNSLGLPSGIYFYHLQTSGGVNTIKKMQLIK